MTIRLLVVCPWGLTSSPKTLSGIPFYLLPELSKFNFDIQIADVEKFPSDKKTIFEKLLKVIPSEKRYVRGSNLSVAKKMSSWFTEQVEIYKPDAILTFGLAPLAFSNPSCPTFLYLDSVYAYKPLVYSYMHYKNISKKEWEDINFIDTQGLRKAKKVFFTTKIISQSAAKIYPEFHEKMVDTGIGANFNPPELNIVKRNLHSKEIDLIIVYSSFERKGLDIAIKTGELLIERGYKVTLHALGEIPPKEFLASFSNGPLSWVMFYGWIDKSSPEGADIYTKLLLQSHVHILPTRGDLSPHTICEANAFGLPTVAHNLAGISDLVINGESGVLIENLEPKDYASGIIQVVKNLGDYSLSALNLYKRYQNWSVVARNICSQISQTFFD